MIKAIPTPASRTAGKQHEATQGAVPALQQGRGASKHPEAMAMEAEDERDVM